MKKNKGLAIIGLSVISMLLSSCGSGTGDKGDYKNEYRTFYGYDPNTFNYAVSNKGEDSAHFANFVDGLYEGDRFGVSYRPALADGEPEEYRWSKDGKTGLGYKVKVKRNIPWVDADGKLQTNKYGYLKPSDFVTVAEYSLDYNLNQEADSTAYMYITFVRGAEEFFLNTIRGSGNFKTTVGIHADDDEYTISYDLIEELSVESFKSALTYSCFLPINAEFYASVDVFGKTTNRNSILYNGGYTLKKFLSGNTIEYQKNPNYWDKDTIKTPKIVLKRYPESAQPSLARGYFENGEVDGFVPNVKDINGYKKYVTGQNNEGNFYDPVNDITQVIEGVTSSTIWYDTYNFNRIQDNATTAEINASVNSTNTMLRSAAAGNTGYAKSQNSLGNNIQAQILNTKKALRNRNFRLGLLHSFPRHLDLSQFTPHNPQQWMRNTMTMPDFTQVEANVDYTKVIAEYLAADSIANPDSIPSNIHTELTVDSAVTKIADGNDAFYNLDLAEFYFEKAQDELSDVIFPVAVMSVYPYTTEEKMYREEYEKFFNGGVAGASSPIPQEEYGKTKDYFNYITVGLNSDLYTNVSGNGTFDVLTVGWTPDYADPLTYVATHCTGGLLSEDVNKLSKTKDATVSNQIFGKIDEAIIAAKEAGNNQDKIGRLRLLAKAEYHMVMTEAVVVPLYATNIGTALTVSKVLPYQTQRNPVGLATDKYKSLIVFHEPVTRAQRIDLKKIFDEEKAAYIASLTHN